MCPNCAPLDGYLWLCTAAMRRKETFFFFLLLVLLEYFWRISAVHSHLLFALLLQKGSVPWDYSYFIPLHFVLLLLYRSRVKSHRKFSIGIKICDAAHTDVGGLLLMWCGVLGRAVFEKRRKDTGLGCLFKLGAGAGVRVPTCRNELV